MRFITIRCLFILSLIVFIAFGCRTSETDGLAEHHTRTGLRGMVVTAHPLASKLGCEILENGGNAFDAAAAVQFALQVVYPRAGNIGGGGFAVIRFSDGKVRTLDFREKAPLAAHRDMYLDSNGNVVSDKSKTGIFSVGVPGTVAGIEVLQRNYGKMLWTKVVAPAVQLAIEGFPLTKGEANVLNRYRDDIIAMNGEDNPYVKSELWQEGDTVRLLELGETLFRIGEKGVQEFYNGRVAQLILAESEKRGGLITRKDLRDYSPVWREPIVIKLNEFTVYSMGPPSSGGIALAQLLKGASRFEIWKYPHNGAKAIHLMTELERLVYADRATYLGDPDFCDVPQKMLLSNSYLNKRFSTINISKATPSDHIKAGHVELIESHETTHYSIVDQWGNAVSITTTLNGNFGSKVIVNGAGFFLNNQMDDFSVKPGVPNQYGLVGGEANSIQPQKRMLSSMTPTIVEKNGKLWMVVGTPGGSTIITTTYQTIQNAMWYGMDAQQAVNSTKTHSQWLPDIVYAEKGKLDTLTIDSLEHMGHEVRYWDVLGKMSVIRVLDDGTMVGAPDYLRGENTANGY